MKQKRIFPNECLYPLALVILAVAVSMVAASDFGVSMVVAPAYLISLSQSVLTFGQCEYVVQGVMFAVFCLLMRRIKPVYFAAFVTCLLYGAVLDAVRAVVPILNPAVTAPGSMPFWQRIVLFAGGMLLTSLAVAMFFRTYFYPQVCDFVVKGLSDHFRLDRIRFKRWFDLGLLGCSVALSFILFGRLRGIGIGTVVLTLLNGILIGWFGKGLDRLFEYRVLFPKLERVFAVE